MTIDQVGREVLADVFDRNAWKVTGPGKARSAHLNVACDPRVWVKERIVEMLHVFRFRPGDGHLARMT